MFKPIEDKIQNSIAYGYIFKYAFGMNTTGSINLGSFTEFLKEKMGYLNTEFFNNIPTEYLKGLNE